MKGLIMKYWHARVYTPFYGEEADVYIQAETQENAILKAREAACESGMEWYDEEEWLEYQQYDKDSDNYDEVCDEYYAQCGVSYLDAITKDEYEYREKEGEWCI